MLLHGGRGDDICDPEVTFSNGTVAMKRSFIRVTKDNGWISTHDGL